MTRRLDADFWRALALRRVSHGAVTNLAGTFYHRERPWPPGRGLQVLELLVAQRYLTLETTPHPRDGHRTASLTVAGEVLLAELEGRGYHAVRLVRGGAR